MREIWIPECIAAAFLILHLARPLIKGLGALDGLTWLPLLALGISTGLFPAYGFRPECIPLLLFALFLTVKHIPSMIFSASSRQNDDFQDRTPVFTVLGFGFLGASLLLMFVFSPKIPAGLTVDGVELRQIRDESDGRVYFLRIYGPVSSADESGGPGIRPLIFLIPPEAGSVTAVDRICAGLRDRGFTVICYSRRGFDFPAAGENGRLYLISPLKLSAMWRAFRKGTEMKKANEQGKNLEAERLKDIDFLLPRLPAALENTAGSVGPLFGKTPLILAGYGAGGGALVSFSESAAFSARFANVRGIVAVESRFWTAYRADPPVFPEVPKGAAWHLRFRMEMAKRFGSLKPRRLTGLGPLPRPGVPLLCLVSDRVTAAGRRPAENPYPALMEILRNSPRPAILAAIEGAGPLDYGDYPLSRPLYSVLFPGRGRLPSSVHEDTVSVISNFAATLLARELPAEKDADTPSLVIPAQKNIGAVLHIETWGTP
ncbi:MAG: hypothetical protein LBG57_12480 [Treponema sp.]|jgi:hypothetical protein|nr:hypothetical protein [Treponema sp.]